MAPSLLSVLILPCQRPIHLRDEPNPPKAGTRKAVMWIHTISIHRLLQRALTAS